MRESRLETMSGRLGQYNIIHVDYVILLVVLVE